MTSDFICITNHYSRNRNPLVVGMVKREPGERGKPAVPSTLREAARLCVDRERLLDAAVRVMGRMQLTPDSPAC
jgi:hypothetical protein